MYAAIRFGMLAIAAVGAAIEGAREFPRMSAGSIVAFAAAFALYTLLLRINVPSLSAVFGKRRHLQPGRLTLEIPVVVAVLTIFGPGAAGAMQICGYACAVSQETRTPLLRRLLDGGADAFVWLFLGVMRPVLLPPVPPLSGTGFAAFTAYYAGSLILLLFVLWMPMRAFLQETALRPLLQRQARDLRLLLFMTICVSWGYVCAEIWLHGGGALALAACVPLPAMALTLRKMHDQSVDIHRLRLARDAVQAMLRTNDPLPQINSLLASLHSPGSEETLQIYASMSADERPALLATVGALPDSAQQEGSLRTIADLAITGRPSLTHRAAHSAVSAYSVRANDGELLGALLVHRSGRSSSLLQARRFMQAAEEIAPLLRDVRSIAATQKAARIDALTGLPNRRTIMEILRERIENVTVANPCAVLLLDIDHFKAINDALGHQTGDTVLRSVGSIIAQNIRSEDAGGRIGGEEFVVLMPDTTSDLARNVGERLRQAIEDGGFQHADGQPLTASIGVAVAAVADTVDSLLARADRALYQAKRQGRNRVIEISA